MNEAAGPVLELGGPKGQGNSKSTTLEQQGKLLGVSNRTQYVANTCAEVLKFNGISALGSQIVSGQGSFSKTSVRMNQNVAT